jgi:arylsulfatase A-like enzyme
MARGKTNVVLVSLDTQRADHFGCYGYQRATSPFIDSLARNGVVFERFYSPNIPTHPAFTTMLTGKEAITHNIVNISGRGVIADGVKLLPELLQTAGYHTIAVDTMGRHFTRGFDTYATYEWDRSNPNRLPKAAACNATAIPLMQQAAAGDKPFFLFVHYWDPHTPYLPPPPYDRKFYSRDKNPRDKGNTSMDPVWNFEPFKWYFHQWMPGVTDAEFVIAQYDGETAYMDRHLRAFFQHARSAGLYENTIFIINADHGEILMEQEGQFDHHGLYEGNIHVPLIMFAPALLPRGRRVSGFTQQFDLAPTILDMLGVRDTECMEGMSLIPAIFGLRDRNYEEIYLSEATWELKRGVRTDRWKFIDSLEQDFHGRPMQELFDLHADPTEQHNLVAKQPGIAAELQGRLADYVARRLRETKRDVDPIRAQGLAGTRIGVPRDEGVGRAWQLPKKPSRQSAAAIPSPDDLNAPRKP